MTIQSSSERGFTLVEAATAIVVMSVGMIAVANLFLLATRTNAAARTGAVAADVAAERMAALKATPFVQLAALPSGSEQVLLDGAASIVVTWEVLPVSPRVLAVTVTAGASGYEGRLRTVLTGVRACATDELPCATP